MFLSAGFGCSNRRRMTDLTVDSEFFHQVHKPLHRPSRFDPYAHRTWKRGIKLPHAVAFVRESLVHNFSRRGVQHRQRLLASMQVTSYNPHLGLLRSEHCWGEHRTVYSGRREADVVMTSTGHVGPSTHLSDYPTNQDLAVDETNSGIGSSKRGCGFLLRRETTLRAWGDLSGRFGPVLHRPSAGCP